MRRSSLKLAGPMASRSLFCLLLLIDVTFMDPVRASNEPNLVSICNDKQVSLTKISTTRRLIEEIRSQDASSERCARYKESFEQLDDILVTVQSGKICNLLLVDKIRRYHENFIASTDKKICDNIPRSLRHFFISLCFQISAECKMSLINNLEYDTKEKLTDSDYEEIKFLENIGATLLDSDTEISDFDDILLLDDMNQMTGLNEQETSEDTRLLVEMKTNNMMRKLVKNCNNKFKPFYDKLIMPLIKLSNLGYNYQGELLKHELLELRQNALVKRWYNIVQTCEAFRAVHIYEDQGDYEFENNRQVLTFISREKADSLRQRNVKTIEEELAAEESKNGDEKNSTIDYDPIASHNDDELQIIDPLELENLVRKYKASSSEADRIRSKMLKKLLAHVKETIMSGKVLMVTSELVKSSFSGTEKEEVTSVNEDIIKMMDEAVEQDEFDKGKRTAYALEGAVSGPRCAIPGTRTRFRPRMRDGTKLSKKLSKSLAARFLPKKSNIFMWIIAIMGCLMIFIALAHG